jgi:hypothetical protein
MDGQQHRLFTLWRIARHVTTVLGGAAYRSLILRMRQDQHDIVELARQVAHGQRQETDDGESDAARDRNPNEHVDVSHGRENAQALCASLAAALEQIGGAV